MAEAGPPLRVERSHDRVVATLDRPATRNAIDQELVDALHALCAELEAEPRVLILTGAGGVFASGADIAQLRERRAEDALKGINTTAFRRIRRLPMPVIAADRRLGARRRRGTRVRRRHPDRHARGEARESRDRPRDHRGGRRHLASARDRRPRPSERAAADRAHPDRATRRWRGGSSPPSIPPTTCCRRLTRSRTGSRRTTRSPPATPRRRCSRPPTRIPRSSSSCRPSSSRAPRRCAA